MSTIKKFSEASLGLRESDRVEDLLYRRLAPDGTIIGEDLKLGKDLLLKMFEGMLTLRKLDETLTRLSSVRELGPYPPYKGQEAIQEGSVLALESKDWLVPMYRDNGAIFTKGLPVEQILLYWSGDERGMRIPEGVTMLPIATPVSTNLPHACGLALAQNLKGTRAVVLVSAGDGATSKGDFHESLNLAGVDKLPVVFVIENNQWAISVPRERQTASKTIAQKAIAYGFEGILVDGNDVIATYEATKYAAERARRGEGPTLIECYTYRMGLHSTSDLVSLKLVPREELQVWTKRDPIDRLRLYLRSLGVLNDDLEATFNRKASKTLENAVESFRRVAQPDPLDMFRYTYTQITPNLQRQMQENFGRTEQTPQILEEKFATGGEPTNIRNAVNLALKEEMSREKRIIVFGEDVGKNGGVFQVTRGLQDLFGVERVFDTPLAESSIAGIFVGLSAGGMIPVAEFQFDGFTYPALDQIFNHVSRMRSRSRGSFEIRGVLRFPYGGGIKGPESHSESPEAHFCHTPGLKVVVPSNPYDAKGLLTSALREPNPVVFMEPKRLYDSPKIPVPKEEFTVPLGRARVLKEGNDVTIISFGAMMVPTLEAADALKSKYSVEVIDLRTLSPLDMTTISKSTEKTGRVVIVHEAPKTCGIGAEIAAEIANQSLLHLKSPIERVTGYDVVMPLGRLEDYYLPTKERTIKAVNQAMQY